MLVAMRLQMSKVVRMMSITNIALSRTPKVGGGGQPAEGVLRETLF